MPDLKISQLPVAPFITDSALIAVVQAGVTQQINRLDFLAGVVGSAGGTNNFYAKFDTPWILQDALLSDDGTNVILPSGKFITGGDITRIVMDFGTTGSEYWGVDTTGGSYSDCYFYIQKDYVGSNNLIEFIAKPSFGISIDQSDNKLYLLNTLVPTSRIQLNTPITNINGTFSISPQGTYANGTYTFLQYQGSVVGDVADCYQLYAADIVAGNAAPHFRTENGDIIKLYKYVDVDFGNTINSGDADTNDAIDAIIAALTAHGLIATS